MIFFLLIQVFLIVLGFINGWWFLSLLALIWLISTLASLTRYRPHISKEARAMGYEICPKCGKTFDTLDPEQLRALRNNDCC